eukprot:scaffold3450_cov114-Cylindrotheca_fusiformis.AAC.6
MGDFQAVKAILGERVKCTCDDGRVATGELVCLDRIKNLILSNVVEERWVYSEDYSRETTLDRKVLVRRELSQAMVPGSRLLRVEIEKRIYVKNVKFSG